jgi:two-component system, OmpR family, response regulator
MKKVLVADDAKNIRTLLAKSLQTDGYEVETAGDGREALEKALRTDPDVMLLDIKLPLISGTEVLTRLREAGKKTPVIIITAYATVKNAVDCTKMGAVAYLQKPFSINKVRSVLKELEETTDASGRPKHRKPEALRLIMSQQYDEAISLLQLLLAEAPLDRELYLMLARAHEGAGSPAEAGKFRRLYQSLDEDLKQ